MSDYVNFKPFCSDLDVNLDLRSLSLVRAHEIVPCMYVCVCVCVCVCIMQYRYAYRDVIVSAVK